jgi:hypothetical protein
MSNVSPSMILAKVAESVPHECLPNIIIIGSLAAGYHFFGKDKDLFVRTKDIDGLLRPRNRAVESGKAVAEKLLSSGWRPKEDGAHGQPGNKDTPENQLPAVRLHPPDSSDWFIERLCCIIQADTQRGYAALGKTWGIWVAGATRWRPGMSPALASATFVLIHALEERPRRCGILTPGLCAGT